MNFFLLRVHSAALGRGMLPVTLRARDGCLRALEQPADTP